ncbi:MAG: polysaccharide biosynthesis/export family protein [Pseudomonadota bacterium]
MKQLTTNMLLLLATLILLYSEAFAAAQPPSDSGITDNQDYIIGHGDILNIHIWKDDALAKRVTVLPDGRIAFPLIGEITAGGKTVTQLRGEIEQGLKRFVPDPILNVEVEQVNSMLIYVIGKVNHPGRFLLNTNIDILQALSMAGGLNPFAEKEDIKVFRKLKNETRIFHFNYDAVAKGNELSQNIILERGDVIVVP